MKKIKPKIKFLNLCRPVTSWDGWQIYLLPTIGISYDGWSSADAEMELSIDFRWLFFIIMLFFEKEEHRG